MLDLSKLIDIQYLLNPTPDYQFAFLLPLVTLFALFLTAGILLEIVPQFRRHLWRHQLAKWFRWLGALGLLLVFFRYEDIAYLSARIYFYLLAFGFLIWLGLIIRNIKIHSPQISEQTIRHQTYDKYLPRRKSSGSPQLSDRSRR